MRAWYQHGNCAVCGLHRYRKVTSETYDAEPFVCGKCQPDYAKCLPEESGQQTNMRRNEQPE